MADSDDEEKLVAPADFDGPVADRHCTDILLLLLLWGMWIAMMRLGIYAVTEGDYRLIVNPLDYDGNICGTSYGELDTSDFPKLYYVNSYTGGVCVRRPPSVSAVIDNKTDEIAQSRCHNK